MNRMFNRSLWSRLVHGIDHARKDVRPAALPAGPLYSGIRKAAGTAACRQDWRPHIIATISPSAIEITGTVH
jgi:hypothetical protein